VDSARRTTCVEADRIFLPALANFATADEDGALQEHFEAVIHQDEHCLESATLPEASEHFDAQKQ
jgi:hypothetical protein